MIRKNKTKGARKKVDWWNHVINKKESIDKTLKLNNKKIHITATKNPQNLKLEISARIINLRAKKNEFP